MAERIGPPDGLQIGRVRRRHVAPGGDDVPLRARPFFFPGSISGLVRLGCAGSPDVGFADSLVRASVVGRPTLDRLERGV
jgi:hypothetical protein